MEKKIAVLGSGAALVALDRLQDAQKEVKCLTALIKESEVILYTKKPDMRFMDIGNRFKCKGKHQYREINGQWICECGRNIND